MTAKAFAERTWKREWRKEDKQRLTTNMAIKSPDVNNYLSTSPYQGRHKDERQNIADSYKTTTKPVWVANWHNNTAG